MGKHRRTRHSQMPHLRAWRESVGLSRQAVADRILELLPGHKPVDQATIAKWETGETGVKVEDLELLAAVYGVSPDRLFFAPGDPRTPEQIRRAFEVITSADPDLVEGWLRTGEGLRLRRERDEARKNARSAEQSLKAN